VGNPRCLGLSLFAATLIGCGEVAETYKEAPSKAPPIDLSAGKVDATLVGVWKNPVESYTLDIDGTFKMHFDRMERSGPGNASLVRKVGDLSGTWSRLDDSLLLAVKKGDKHKLNIVLHDHGATLEMRPTFMKKGQGTIYKREKSGIPDK